MFVCQPSSEEISGTLESEHIVQLSLQLREMWRDVRLSGIARLMDLDEALYRAHAPELLRFAASLVGPSKADDVVSAAFISASTSSRWSEITDRRAYLYRTILNEVRQARRSDSRRLAREFVAARRETEEPGAPSVELALVLAQLSQTERAVIHLTYWQGCTAIETAEMLELSLRSVERHLHRARARLERALR
jgi:RNA polymerase sigma-70 factor (ECF subfamily)